MQNQLTRRLPEEKEKEKKTHGDFLYVEAPIRRKPFGKKGKEGKRKRRKTLSDRSASRWPCG